MVNRNQVRCGSCGEIFTIRVTVSGGLQPFVFPCPCCSAQLRGSFYAEQPTGPPTSTDSLPPFELKSEDFDRVKFDRDRETAGMLCVEVNTELPVHTSLLRQPVTEVRATPFILLMQACGMTDEAADVTGRAAELRQMRFELLPYIRRAAASVGAGEMARAETELSKIPGYADSGLARTDPWSAVGLSLKACLSLIGGMGPAEEATDELRSNLDAALTNDRDATRALVESLNSKLLPAHRRMVLETSIRTLETNDALVPGMWMEILPEGEVNAYRVQRSDFDETKTRYQEIFELASRTIVLPAMVANFLNRGDAREYSDGQRRSPREALKIKAQTREGWLDELPATKGLYEKAVRRSRNLIGHHLISYDYERAALVDDGGRETNYLEFLLGYLEIVRLLPFLLDVVDFLTDIEQAGPPETQTA